MVSQEILESIHKDGTYYNPANSHYDSSGFVNCDRCSRLHLCVCIGWRNYDICMKCVDALDRTRNGKDSEDGYPPAANQCKIEGCHNCVVERKMCKRHAYGTCKTSGCKNIATARGICVKHGAYGKCPIENCGKGAIHWIRFNGKRVKVCNSHSTCKIVNWDLQHTYPKVYNKIIQQITPHLH